MTTPIFGRGAELTVARAMLDEVRTGPAGLTIEGDIGAGKSTLWRAAVAEAREMRFRILESQPAESEESLPYAALGDLLENLVEDPGLELPAPQRRALRVAVLLEEAREGPSDQRAVSVAVLSALRSLAKHSPVLVAVDDLQWMDRPSARVLEFVVRRLQDDRVGILAAFRTGALGARSELFDRSFSGRQPHRLVLEPLGHDALDALLHARLGGLGPPSLVAQVHRASGGNPLFALEIARGIQRGEIHPTVGEPLPVPRTLREYARKRLLRLPREVRDLLFLAAAAADPTMDLLEGAESSESVAAAVEVAEEAGVVEVTADRLRFVHPLFASTLYHAVPAARRRALHRRLATLVHDPDERARHLALGAAGSDATAAEAIEAAARRAAGRGAPDAAAELAERAHELTPADDAEGRERRRIEAGEYHFVSGNLGRARQIFEEMAAVLAPGPVRASVLRRLAKVRYRNDSCSIAAQLLTRALEETEEDGTLRAQVERDLAWAVMLCGDMEAAAGHARSALELVRGGGHDPMYAEVLAATAMAEFLQGGGLARDTLERAIGLEGTGADTPIEWRPSMMLGIMLNWSGATAEARRRFDDLHRRAIEAAEETSLPFLLAQMSESATWDGDLAAAMDHADRAIAMSVRTGQKPMRSAAFYARALAEAHLGVVDVARTSARSGLELAEEVGSVVMMMWNQSVLGFIELSEDDPGAAHGHLAPLVAWREVVGIREPGLLRFMPDEIEALLSLGDLDKADALLLDYEAEARRLERPWAQLAAARCRALHAAAGREARQAVDALRMALEQHAAVQPFERARALLVLGSIQRRTRRRKDALGSLQAAQELFDALGARTWAAKAQRLRGRAAGSGRGSLEGDLTPAERRVAQVVAGGATNREAAARLFVTVRTVEVHLTSVYRKLGIRSRTELAARMADDLANGR